MWLLTAQLPRLQVNILTIKNKRTFSLLFYIFLLTSCFQSLQQIYMAFSEGYLLSAQPTATFQLELTWIFFILIIVIRHWHIWLLNQLGFFFIGKKLDEFCIPHDMLFFRVYLQVPPLHFFYRKPARKKAKKTAVGMLNYLW